jgi:hypothetical protein
VGRGRATDASATQIEAVRVAPSLTDGHASEEELVAQIERLLATADEREKAAAKGNSE